MDFIGKLNEARRYLGGLFLYHMVYIAYLYKIVIWFAVLWLSIRYKKSLKKFWLTLIFLNQFIIFEYWKVVTETEIL